MRSLLFNRTNSLDSPPSLSSSQILADSTLAGFTHELENPLHLTAMIAGGLAFRASHLLLNKLASPLLSQSGLIARGFAQGSIKSLSLFSEVAVFRTISHRSFSIYRSSEFINDMLGFGSLKGAGLLAHGNTVPIAHILQSGAMVASHHIGHGLGICLKPEGSLLQQFAEAEAINLKLGFSMSALHTLAPGISRLERAMDVTTQSLRFRQNARHNRSQESNISVFGFHAEDLPARKANDFTTAALSSIFRARSFEELICRLPGIPGETLRILFDAASTGRFKADHLIEEAADAVIGDVPYSTQAVLGRYAEILNAWEGREIVLDRAIPSGVKSTISQTLTRHPIADTRISSVTRDGDSLRYRGYDIYDLVGKPNSGRQPSYEEIVYLLLQGRLPNRSELEAFSTRLRDQAVLSESTKATLRSIPKTDQTMDLMQMFASLIGIEARPETKADIASSAADLLAKLPVALAYWYHHAYHGREIPLNASHASIAEHFLFLLHGREISRAHVDALNVLLILFAEHGLNASAFAARVVQSTRFPEKPNFYAVASSGIGALAGLRHGGTPTHVAESIHGYSSPEHAENDLAAKLEDPNARIPGYGHAIYPYGDPRYPLITDWLQALPKTPEQANAFAILNRMDSVMLRQKRRRALPPGVGSRAALMAEILGVPPMLISPIVAWARVAGYGAHAMEQREDQIIRPQLTYVGEDWGKPPLPYVPLDGRE